MSRTSSRLCWTEDGELLFLSKEKGSNPGREKHPTVRCPNCGGLMYYIYNKETKNDLLCYDLADPKYKNYPRYMIRICKKCHHRIGILILNPKVRRMMHLPQMHECHEKLVI